MYCSREGGSVRDGVREKGGEGGGREREREREEEKERESDTYIMYIPSRRKRVA